MTVAIDRATGKRRGDRAPRPGPGQRLKRSYQKHWYAYAMIAPVVLASPKAKARQQPAPAPAVDSVIEKTIAASSGERMYIDLRPGGV